MPTFTLEQIAHFNRCLFFEDFHATLVRHGLTVLDAHVYARYACIENRAGGIMGLYQEYAVNNPELQSVINAILVDFLKPR